MSGPNRSSPGVDSPLARLSRPTGRRDFLRWTGVGAAGVFVAACDEATRTIVEVTPPDTIIQTDTVAPPPEQPAAVTLDFGTNPDFAVANFAYALEQLEASFYIMVANNMPTGLSSEEREVLLDLRDHEIAHRDFFAAGIPALGGTLIPQLTFDFSAVDFSSRESVLQTARTFEDLGVAAYNGAATLLTDMDILAVAGKIVSVEARHASAIAHLIARNGMAFAPSAFDDALPPDEVIAAADPFIVNPITVTGLPASNA